MDPKDEFSQYSDHLQIQDEVSPEDKRSGLQKKSLKDMELLNVIENTSMFLKEFQRNTM